MPSNASFLISSLINTNPTKVKTFEFSLDEAKAIILLPSLVNLFKFSSTIIFFRNIFLSPF